MRTHTYNAFTLTALVAVTLATATAGADPYSITVLHNNDGESDLFGDGAVGGVAQFATAMDAHRSFYEGAGHGVVSVYAGDSFIPSPEFQASLDSGAPGSRTFFDALALNGIGYDAAVLGNHEFDAGPAVLGEFLDQVSFPYLSANLDFSAEPALATKPASSLASSTLVSVSTAAGPKNIGIIGATTENLSFISSPGGVTVSPVAAAVNAEIASLLGMGADNLVLVSHLQGINEDLALVSQLNPGIDLVVAGGGDEILADLGAPSPSSALAGAPASVADTGILPGDSLNQSAYPNLTATDSGGNTVPVATGGPNYGYLGRVTLQFDMAGDLLGVESSSNPAIVSGFAPDAAVAADVAPVQTFLDNLDATVIAQSSEQLLGNSNRDVIRAKEAGLGNLIADAFLAAATAEAAGLGLDVPKLAIANGGGIRNDIDAGDVTLKTTFDIAPFGNTVSIVEDITRDDLKLIFENAYSKTVGQAANPVRDSVDGTGRFLHVSEGVEVVYDIRATPMLLSTDTDPLTAEEDGDLLVQGERIVSLVIDGMTIIENGEVVPGDPIDLAVVDFLANGGDQIFNDNYLSQSYAFTRVAITDQNALRQYIEDLAGGDTAFDVISDARYDNVADGRIVAVPEPTSVLAAFLAIAGVLAAWWR
ncbi:MAG: bifunctional metallophosphatase/5'-nucleotidase [Planctomycetota bacterium]